MLNSIHELSNIEIESIISNINTGIEFEIAIYFHLNNNVDKEIIKDKIINHHPLRDKIEEIISNFDTYSLRSELNLVNEPEATYLTTQDDTVGPSDIVMKINQDLLGLSIKYANNCNLNISGSHFLSAKSIVEIQSTYREFGQRYITEMESLYGNASNWFRMRKTSIVVNEIIDLIRDKVLNDWSNHLTVADRLSIIKLAFHFESPIRFYIARIDKLKGKYTCEINKNPIRELSIDGIILKKYQTSFISFEYNKVIFALMQIKFNNGILEKPKGGTCDYEIDRIKMKFGSPLSSWNFNLK
jgi:hypothetical protein